MTAAGVVSWDLIDQDAVGVATSPEGVEWVATTTVLIRRDVLDPATWDGREPAAMPWATVRRVLDAAPTHRTAGQPVAPHVLGLLRPLRAHWETWGGIRRHPGPDGAWRLTVAGAPVALVAGIDRHVGGLPVRRVSETTHREAAIVAGWATHGLAVAPTIDGEEPTAHDTTVHRWTAAAAAIDALRTIP